MDSSNASTTNGVYLPNFPLATGDLLRAIEHSGSVMQTWRDDAREYYAMAMATTKLAEEVMENAIIVIRLTAPSAGEVLDFTFVAAADCMYFQLHRITQLRCTYGHCAAFSADHEFSAFLSTMEVGAVFKFPSIFSYIVASTELAAAVRAVRGADVD
jgi:hypothetical protein